MNKRNFYLRSLPASERKFVGEAASIEGIDDEIVLLRITIKAMLEEEPRNTFEILHTTAMLGKLIKIRFSLSGNHKKGLEESFEAFVREYLVPNGITSLPQNPYTPSTSSSLPSEGEN